MEGLMIDSNVSFCTVTNARYFPGTVATVSSIRMFYPLAPVWVFAEHRHPLTTAQTQYLDRLPGVRVEQAGTGRYGKVEEAWQLKAHALNHLQRTYAGTDVKVITLIDSDLVLAHRIEPMIGLADVGRIVGGRDGKGPVYDADRYDPYGSLCASTRQHGTHHNPHYVSTSLVSMPIDSVFARVCQLWSRACDAAVFGPSGRGERIYWGHGDQGVLNAILYFCGIEPALLDNDVVSEHGVHGKVRVEPHEGRFDRAGKMQLAFHSVGRSPKFWAPVYAANATPGSTLEWVYLYWLFLLFDGPAGLLNGMASSQARAAAGDLFPGVGHDLLGEYERRRRPVLRRLVKDVALMEIAGPHAGLIPHPAHARASPNLMVTVAADGYFDRPDVQYLYSATRRFQSYRMAGGRADLVLFVNDAALGQGLTETLARTLHNSKVSVLRLPDLPALLATAGIDVRRWLERCPELVRVGVARGVMSQGLTPAYNVIRAMEVFLAKPLLMRLMATEYGYERVAWVDADGGSYGFDPTDVPAGTVIDDVWRFDAFTDFVYRPFATGAEEGHRITRAGLAEVLGLALEPLRLPMFQVQGHWYQGTAAAVARFAELFAAKASRFVDSGYFPAEEIVATSVLLDGEMRPFGIAPGEGLSNQIAATAGRRPNPPLPYYPRPGESKYAREFLSPPDVGPGRYAVCICGFDRLAGGRRYSAAARERALAYRQLMGGTRDVHVFTDRDDLRFDPADRVVVHRTDVDELNVPWDPRLAAASLVEHMLSATQRPAVHKSDRLVKRAEYAPGMVSKLTAAELLLSREGYDGVLSADADGDQFSAETVGALGRHHIDGVWAGLQYRPFVAYLVGTTTDHAYHTWLTVLRSVAGLPPGDHTGPIDWIWGPCWMIGREFGLRFLRDVRTVAGRLLDAGAAFHDEHLLNCAYNLPAYDDNPLGGMRDLGEVAEIGYRGVNPSSLVKYTRWATCGQHKGRQRRPTYKFYGPPFEYRT